MPDKKIIDEKTVKHIAGLSRLRLTAAETGLYIKQLASILDYISKLNELNVSGIPSTSHPLENLKNVFRKDALKLSLPEDEVLLNAPERKDNFFSVPKIIE